jgi:hypothetical protein
MTNDAIEAEKWLELQLNTNLEQLAAMQVNLQIGGCVIRNQRIAQEAIEKLKAAA